MQFFNGDFRHSADFQTYFANQQEADQLYSNLFLGEEFRYGLAAGLVPSPEVYHADRIMDHPHDVFSPEAVAAWGDMDTLLQFYNAQIPTSNPSYQLCPVARPRGQPELIPPGGGFGRPLFLFFGPGGSLDADFLAGPGFAPLE